MGLAVVSCFWLEVCGLLRVAFNKRRRLRVFTVSNAQTKLTGNQKRIIGAASASSAMLPISPSEQRQFSSG